MLDVQNTALIVVDIQGKLARIVHESGHLIESAARTIRGAQVLGLPVIATEQNPAGLGPTVEELAPLLAGEAISKTTFSCCREPRFNSALELLERNDLLVVGIEAHICVYLTVVDLIGRGFEAHVVADAVSSRSAGNREIGLSRMRDAGASLTSVEMALFELPGAAEGEKFKDILKIVK